MRVVCPAVAVLAALPSVSVRCCYCTKVHCGGSHKAARQLAAATHACCCSWLLTPRLMVFNSSGGHLLGYLFGGDDSGLQPNPCSGGGVGVCVQLPLL